MKFNWLNIKGSIATELCSRSIEQVIVSPDKDVYTDLILCRSGQVDVPLDSGTLKLHSNQALLCDSIDSADLAFYDQANIFHLHFDKHSLKFSETNCRDGRCWRVDKDFILDKKDLKKYELKKYWQQISDNVPCSDSKIKDQLQSLKVEAFLGALYLLCDNMKEIKIAQSNKSLTTYQSIKNNILENFHTPMSRESVAKEMGISEIQISKLFQRFDENTFQQTLAGTRLEFTSVLLSDPKLKSEELSKLALFSNKENFSQAFKKYFTFTPSEMRKKF